MSLHKKPSIIFLATYPQGISPGQRFRFEQYCQLLSKNYDLNIVHLLSVSQLDRRKSIGNWLRIFSGIARRCYHFLLATRYNYVFIFREALPFGPPVFEFLLSRVMGKKIIYDFDDTIWLTDNINESWLQRTLRWRRKVALICKWSHTVSVGNTYLADFARLYNDRVIINPTTIDTESLHNPALYKRKPRNSDSTIIGWTGSHSTLKYLKEIESALQAIERKYPSVNFLVIADQQPNLTLHNLIFIPWNKETEIEDLLQIDIGIMPLPDDDWTKGKCGFKALQYMALEIPAVVSPVGVNREIVDHGINGFWCQTETDWIDSIEKLISNKVLIKKMGENGRKKVKDRYSVLSNTSNFLSLFE